MTLKIPTRDGQIVMAGGFVRLNDQSDERGCKCCAASCESSLTVSVTFCGMTVTETIAIPGILGQGTASLPDGSYLVLSAQMSCSPCGWDLLIGVCAYCEATGQAASDGFTALIPFAAAEEAAGGYCPQTGAVALECFGLEFGIPCVTNPTATIG